ncbi:MAG: hypothetical protein WED33_03875 [Bacteroidia bacterium]
MIKDIHIPEVTDIAVAIVHEEFEGEPGWFVYLLNLKSVALEGALVSSKGYGEIEGESKKTSILRHFLDVVEPMSFVKVEPIMEDVFSLSNEYWVSFYIEKLMYDKKFIFLPETIHEDNFTLIPLIGKKGVMIR